MHYISLSKNYQQKYTQLKLWNPKSSYVRVYELIFIRKFIELLTSVSNLTDHFLLKIMTDKHEIFRLTTII